MDENYLVSILNCTEQCCKLLLCTSCNTLPRDIVTINGLEPIVCLTCAEKQYSSGKIPYLSLIQPNIKCNKVLALLNRTFRTLYDLSDSPNEPKEHIEQKKEAIKEGVLTCLNLLRSTIRETNQIAPVNDSKKKIIIKKKNLNILHNESDEEEKENQSITPEIEENAVRRKTVRGSNASKRSVSIKTPENESPPKRTRTTEDIDAPLSVISPTVVKKGTTPVRKKLSNDGDEKQTKSLRLTRKVQQTADETKSIDSNKSAKKIKKDEETDEKPAAIRKKTLSSNKSSHDVRNDKGESLLHQAVKKADINRVKQLIEEGHSVNTIDHNSWTPMHEASSMGDLPLMKLLLAHNANINVQGGNERITVLHEALLNEPVNESLIKFLLENGADPHIKDKNGKSAIDLAVDLKLSSLFEKTQCTKPSHNDAPIAPPARRRARTTSSSNVLFFTGFDKARKESLIKSVQTIFGRKCVTTARNVENNVTHIVACGEQDKIAFRTINYLRGIVLGKWIVSEKWIDECIKQKQWISESEYEITGSQIEPTSNGSHASRLRHEQNETLLFDKCEFYLYGQFHTYKKEDIADLIKISSATLLKREPKLHRIDSDNEINANNSSPINYIIYETTVPDVLLDNNRIKHITLLDFLACIDYYDTHGRLDN
ncbi:unnamed protein product [Adineta ricciae]|uniref:BRCT domain-containing protein n=1 Tax=Adineta ricciae TaxID=249248 RepID=A0A814S7I2_ADIRI|nr:unnamed protein product [Adineta ricciae]CAF1631801.1 unnamed protein product [Adineta ricciae]